MELRYACEAMRAARKSIRSGADDETVRLDIIEVASIGMHADYLSNADRVERFLREMLMSDNATARSTAASELERMDEDFRRQTEELRCRLEAVG
ncbi:hypothetical protein [Aureimonas sp. AU4]|uniref:hypothetical protein n=1 Tax=Aureimonas sp. AU4 TaxID=1638163 RepID=UPI0007845245|nr:hypothetical protein [Aureimonas sp. AU4]